MRLFLSEVQGIGSNVYLFLLYSVVTVLVFRMLQEKFRTGWLFVSSILFYVVCSPVFLLLLLGETVVGWLIGQHLSDAEEFREQKRADHRGRNEKKKRLLIFGVALCIGILFFFKYYNFFADCFRFSENGLLIPLGISYYTFRIVSYMADIYQGKRAPEPSFLVYAVYVMFFPQLLSGPIARSEGMTERMHTGMETKASDLEAGIRRIAAGMFMKVVIADRLSAYVTTVFAAPEDYPALAAWIGAVLYSIQLYCDFAGYSEIAIGITRCFGFTCPDNFLRPYLSGNMKEFWRRWHISLSSWLRDYIYIPCGGSRTDRRWKIKRNVMLTFAACGLWHGSSVKYLVWGLYHGIWNILTPRNNHKERKDKRVCAAGKAVSGIRKLLSGLLTFLIAMFGWILFKAESFPAAAHYIQCMFRGFAVNLMTLQAAVLPFTEDNSCASYALSIGILILILFFSEIYDEKKGIGAEQYSNMRIGFLTVLVVLFGAAGTGSFLYAGY